MVRYSGRCDVQRSSTEQAPWETNRQRIRVAVVRVTSSCSKKLPTCESCIVKCRTAIPESSAMIDRCYIPLAGAVMVEGIIWDCVISCDSGCQINHELLVERCPFTRTDMRGKSAGSDGLKVKNSMVVVVLDRRDAWQLQPPRIRKSPKACPERRHVSTGLHCQVCARGHTAMSKCHHPRARHLV
jgi:hypothetical protein